MSRDRSRSAGFTGAKPKPQLPSTTDVTPCQPEIVQYGIPMDLRVVVGVQIDEARRDDQPGRVDLARALACGDAADLRDATAANADVRTNARETRSVDYGPTTDHGVELGHAGSPVSLDEGGWNQYAQNNTVFFTRTTV